MSILSNMKYALLLVLLTYGCNKQQKNTTQQDNPSDSPIPVELRELDSLKMINGQMNHLFHALLKDEFIEENVKHLNYSLTEEIQASRAILQGLNEPDYSLEEEGEAVIRFLYTSDIIGVLGSVAVIRDQDSCYIRAKHMRTVLSDSTADYDNRYAYVLDSMIHPIDPEEMYEIYERLDDCFFWDIRGNMTENGGFDGSTWTLEAAVWESIPYSYHKVSRWSPSRGDFYEACMYIVSLCDPKEGFDMNKVIR